MAILTKIGLGTTQFVASFPSRAILTSSFSSRFHRLTSTSEGRLTCECRAELPTTDQIIKGFKERNLLEITRKTHCMNIITFPHVQSHVCTLIERIKEIAPPLLKEFPDVIHLGSSSMVWPGPLKFKSYRFLQEELDYLSGEPEERLGSFLKVSLDRKLIPDIGCVFDIRGRNTRLFTLPINTQNVPSLIVDGNPVIPALSQSQHNVKYLIEDGYTFFTSEAYEEHTRDLVNEKTSLFVFNNMLNAMKAEDGWAVLTAAWERLRIGDCLVISELVPDQLEKNGFFKHHELDGIVEFYEETGLHYGPIKKFHASVLSPTFLDFLNVRIKGVSVLFEETFKFCIKNQFSKKPDIQGRHLLALKKIKA